MVVNPTAKTSADVTLFSSTPSDTSEKSGFVITGPGEYEVKDIFIKGFLSQGPSTGSGQARYNTIYLVTFEGMKLCFLGSLATPELPENTTEALDDIDILFVPTDSHKLAVSLEPSLIIPMSYTKATLDQFLKEAGEKDVSPVDKLVIKKKDLEGKEGEIIVLKEE